MTIKKLKTHWGIWKVEQLHLTMVEQKELLKVQSIIDCQGPSLEEYWSGTSGALLLLLAQDSQSMGCIEPTPCSLVSTLSPNLTLCPFPLSFLFSFPSFSPFSSPCSLWISIFKSKANNILYDIVWQLTIGDWWWMNLTSHIPNHRDIEWWVF